MRNALRKQIESLVDYILGKTETPAKPERARFELFEFEPRMVPATIAAGSTLTAWFDGSYGTNPYGPDSAMVGVSAYDPSTGAESVVFSQAVTGIPRSASEKFTFAPLSKPEGVALVDGKVFLALSHAGNGTNPYANDDGSVILAINPATGDATTFASPHRETTALGVTADGKLLAAWFDGTYGTNPYGPDSATEGVSVYDPANGKETVVFSKQVTGIPHTQFETFSLPPYAKADGVAEAGGKVFLALTHSGSNNPYSPDDDSTILAINPATGAETPFASPHRETRALFGVPGGSPIVPPSPPPPPAPTPPVLVGNPQSVVSSPTGTLTVLNSDGTVAGTLTPFPGSPGEVQTVTTSDGNVVAGTGPGSPAQVKVIDSKTQAVVFNLSPFETTFTGGVYVAGADFLGKGKPQVIVAAGEGGAPRVKIVDQSTGETVVDFFGINDPNFRGGARVSTADVNGDGIPDLIVAAGFGGGPRVTIFDGASIRDGKPVEIANFYVFEQTLRNGVFVAAGDINGDGFADVVVGGGPDGGPRVFAISGKDLTDGTGVPAVLANFFAGDVNNRGGVRLVVKNLDGDQYGDLLTGPGPGGGKTVTAYAGKTITPTGTPPVLFSFDDPSAGEDGVFPG